MICKYSVSERILRERECVTLGMQSEQATQKEQQCSVVGVLKARPSHRLQGDWAVFGTNPIEPAQWMHAGHYYPEPIVFKSNALAVAEGSNRRAKHLLYKVGQRRNGGEVWKGAPPPF